MTLLLVFGTRPEAIKMGPVAAELKAANVPFHALATGQHTDLLRGTPAETDLSGATSLGLASTGNVLRYLGKAEMALRQWLEDRPDYDVVVVQGDTMSALAAARAAVNLQRVLVHVEAGVRSGDDENPWPEEQTRKEISQLADWHYAATPHAFANLLAEGIRHERIRLTGNPVVSALARYTSARPLPPEPHILVTLHRREWLLGPTMRETVEELLKQAEDFVGRVKFLWPVHPAARKALNGKFNTLGTALLTVPPLPYEKAALALASAMGVLTDSGGLQEEAATLGVPCAVMRRATDRPESVNAGVARLFTPDGYGVRAAVAALTGGALPRRPTDLYGDPTAAAQVARHLAKLVGTE